MDSQDRKVSSQKPDQGASRAWQALTPSLSEWILDAVSSMGFSRTTPVQASTIPLFTGNKDVVVEAVTGSGKTLAFLIPVVQRLLRLEEPIRKHHIGAIIISPTRELATQIYTVLLSLLAFHAPSAAYLNPLPKPTSRDENSTPLPPEVYSSSPLRITPQILVGGTKPPSQDLAQFLTNSPNLLISTPGRLLELLSSPHVHCPQSSFEVLVLDEADRLLDLGFKNDLQKILQRLPKQRRTGLFSASVSEAVDQLVRVGLRNPVRIAVKVKGKDGSVDQRTPASLKLAYVTTAPTLKLPYLLNLISHLDQPPQKTIVYLSTCAAVDYFSHVLPNILPIIGIKGHEWSVIPLHGRQTAAHRNTNLSKFIDSADTSLLLTTDLASRGLDIPLVDLTVQLDPPSDPKTFLHRAGRAGRAGRRGLAVVFLTPGRESDEYPAFLAVRKTPVEPLADILPPVPAGATSPLTGVSDAQAEACTAAIRTAVAADRALHDKAQRAFVSFVRSYAAHAASSIFRVGELDWRTLAEAWGLLRLPRMPELKPRGNTSTDEQIDRSLGLSVDWDNFAYRNKQQEAKRRREMLAPPEKSELHSAKRKAAGGTSWSDKVAGQETAAVRRAKKVAKRTAVRQHGLSQEEKHKEMELESMIDQVRRSNNIEEFDGFSD